MQSSTAVTVSSDDWISFTPTDTAPTAGFIFYPGGKVEEQAYAPILRGIADSGYLAVIVPMPFDLAVFGAGKAQNVIETYPEIEVWVIGGHSLGGVMAVEYAVDHPDQIDGVALWASYPAENTSLADSGLAVISISGTLDGLSTPDKINASIPLLPQDTIWISIEGGNHAQFGDYGTQSGDLAAAISPEEQQAQVVEAMVELLAELTP
jgi:pimeloyl-ACP methyl ester carboxylesterase